MQVPLDPLLALRARTASMRRHCLQRQYPNLCVLRALTGRMQARLLVSQQQLPIATFASGQVLVRITVQTILRQAAHAPPGMTEIHVLHVQQESSSLRSEILHAIRVRRVHIKVLLQRAHAICVL